MINDPIVEQVREERNKHAAQFNYDLNAIYEDLKKQEKESKQKFNSQNNSKNYQKTNCIFW